MRISDWSSDVCSSDLLLTLLLPLKVQAVAGDERLVTLTLCALAGAVTASISNIVFGTLSDRSFARTCNRRRWIAGGLAATLATYPLLHWAASPVQIIAAVLIFKSALNKIGRPSCRARGCQYV